MLNIIDQSYNYHIHKVAAVKTIARERKLVFKDNLPTDLDSLTKEAQTFIENRTATNRINDIFLRRDVSQEDCTIAIYKAAQLADMSKNSVRQTQNSWWWILIVLLIGLRILKAYI